MDERLRNQVEKERRDLTILRAVIADGPIGIVKLSDRTDVPEHKVRYSLRMLENDGFVEPTPEGAVPADDIGERLERVNEGIDELVGRLERVRDDEVRMDDAHEEEVAVDES
jgi:predicted transcriptional regulator